MPQGLKSDVTATKYSQIAQMISHCNVNRRTDTANRFLPTRRV